MSRALKIIALVAAIPIVIFGLITINLFVYPFQSKQPNFKDVETAFAKLQFPAEWQEISSSENRGLHGRGCDFFDSSGCFHKSKTFKISSDSGKDRVEAFFADSGCRNVSLDDITQRGESEKTYNFRCSLPNAGIYLTGTHRGPEGEVYISVATY